MKITPNLNSLDNGLRFKSNSSEKKHSKNYDDPLARWPIRGLAYTNEIGAAIMEIAPTLGILMWAPAIFYFGADIYDKYKNDKNSFDPSTLRGTSQAVFQLLASVVLPTTAVLIGQKTASLLGLARKNRLTIQTQENISKFSVSYMERHKLTELEDYKKRHYAALSNSINEKYRESAFRHRLTYFIDKLTNGQFSRYRAKKELRIKKYSNASIDRMFDIRNQLMDGKKPKEFTDKLYSKFHKAILRYKKNPEYAENATEFATKEVLKKYEQSRIFNAKLLKTLGGFISLGLAIKPIDAFVEKHIIERYFEPRLISAKDAKVSSKNVK